MRSVILAATLLLTSGCATLEKANADLRAYMRKVDDEYDCVGIDMGEAALCVDNVALTVTVTF